jgi:hypothetical protein
MNSRRMSGNKNKGLAGSAPPPSSSHSKTSVQTIAYSKRQFALILPSTSTSLMTRQSTLEHHLNNGRRSNKNPINDSRPMQHQCE